MKQEFEQVISETLTLLNNNPEWIHRYLRYSNKITNNLDSIESVRKTFHEWAPLKLYISTTNATNSQKAFEFDLRYLGQSVATLKSKGNLELDTYGKNLTNQRDFGCYVKLHKASWTSSESRKFRKFFKSCHILKNRHMDEHRIESLLLTEFSKSTSKALPGIKPVKIKNLRFSMKTPLSASDHKITGYSKHYGGGIDILTRVGTGGRSTNLCIMEVKDECTKKEPPKDAIKQALAYATFIRELIRSESGPLWWKLFGFGSKIPEKLVLYAACVMPLNEVSDKSFEGMELSVGGDVIKLHYVYFTEKDNEILKIDSSLNPNFKPHSRKEI